MRERKSRDQMILEIEDFLPIIEECPFCHKETLVESCEDLVSPLYSIFPNFVCAHCGRQTKTKMSGFLLGRSYTYNDLMPLTPWRAMRMWLKIKLRLVPLIDRCASVENWDQKKFKYKDIESVQESEKERKGSRCGRRHYVW